MSFLNRFWRIPALALVVALPIFSACADDEGATPTDPSGPTTGTISGQVTSSAGGPIVGALVGTSPATNTGLTDANGNYSITNVPIPGGTAAYAVTASAAGFQSASTSVTLTTDDPTATANLVLTAGAVETDGALNILVTNRQGTPQAGVAVAVVSATGDTVQSGTTDAQGFVLIPTIAAGSYTVTASQEQGGLVFVAAGGVNVVAGETAFIQLTLTRDFDQSVFPNVDGEAATPVDIRLIPVAGSDGDPDIDCNIIRTQHMFIVEVRDATGATFNRVSGVKIQWDLNTSENGTVTIECPDLVDDLAGCGVPTVPGNTGTIVDSDDPDLDPTTARSGLAPSFNVDSRQAVTFTNDGDQQVSFGGSTITVGAGQSWIIVTSPVEGQTDLVVSSPDISRTGDPDADKVFAIKRWVNWDTAVAEVQWPDQFPNIPGWQPGDTRDFFDADDTVFNEIADGDLVTNILDRRETDSIGDTDGDGDVDSDDGTSDNPSYPDAFGCDSDASSASGFQCELTGNRALFLASVERSRPDAGFNLSRGIIQFAELDDNPDVEFWGDDGGDGCTEGVCNVEHNGPSDDEYLVFSDPVEDGPGNDAELAAGEFDANNNVFDGGVITANPLCAAPCDEDDFIGWVIAEVRLDPETLFCTDVDTDGDCDPGEAFSDDTFSTAYQRLLAGTADNVNTFEVLFFDEFGEVCDELTFEKRWVTSRLQIIKSTPDAAIDDVEGFDVKSHTVQVGQTFSYTITAINDGDIQTENVRITDTLPRFGDQFSGPPDAGAPSERNGGQAFQFVRDRPAFDPTAIVYAVDDDNDEAGDIINTCYRGDNGSAVGNAYVPPAPCLDLGVIIVDVGTVEQARQAAISASNSGDQVVYIQWFDDEILGRTQVGGGIQSEDSVEVFLRATPSLYTGVSLPGTWCNIATVTDGPNNLTTDFLTQSFDADTLCHEVREALLDVRKTAQDAVLSAGTDAVFDVEVANLGSTALTNVVIHDTLDAAFLPIDATDIVVNTALFPSATVAVDAGGHIFSVTLGTLAPTPGTAAATCQGLGDGFCLAFTVNATTPDLAGVFCNRVTARGTNAAGTLIETDISCVTTTIAIELDIANEDGFLDGSGTFQSAKDIFHVGDGGPAEPDSLIYELQVTNQSGFTATGVTIVDLVAPNTGIIEYVNDRFVSQGTVTGESTAGFTWNIGTLAPNTGATLRFQAHAVRTGDDVNRASLTADQLTGVKVDEEPTTVSP
ncbi:MAG TPA: carboxypeptidase regulatory-like domain-containing protein [Actinomycetota bacterium]|nr:carboxypeptidase regulatory-like domain-containing protein [Actinomycetota bacterium]